MVSYKSWAVLGQLSSLTAFVLMWMGMARCNFIEFTDTAGTTKPVSMKFGIWYYLGYYRVKSINQNSEPFVLASCRPYDNSIHPDSYWKAARAFSSISFFFAFFVIILNVVSSCQVTNRQGQNYQLTHPWEPRCYLITSLFLGLCFLFLQSNASWIIRS